jgi:hypothetical protein
MINGNGCWPKPKEKEKENSMMKPINEQELDAADEEIPKLASQAFRSAYSRALKSRGHLLVARKGQLVEVNIDGSFRVIRALKAPTQITKGTVRTRNKRHHE